MGETGTWKLGSRKLKTSELYIRILGMREFWTREKEITVHRVFRIRELGIKN